MACPWGEMARNYRMMYLAARIDAGSMGWTEESRDAARQDASRIWLALFGAQPSQGPPKAADFRTD